MEWLGRRRKGRGSEEVRCHDCGLHMSDGWQFDVGRLRMSIDRYMDDWVHGRAVDEELTRRMQDEELRKVAAATPRRGIWKADYVPKQASEGAE